MKQYKVGIIGATGMVGQRFIMLLANHPWFKIEVLAASSRSAGKAYSEAVGAKWVMESEIPATVADKVIMDADADAAKIADLVDFVFCAVDMEKDAVLALEDKYAKLECPVVSNNSANRLTDDVPMVIPEINPHHLEVIEAQKKRLGTSRGFIAVKSNCSLQSYVPMINALMEFEPEKVLACTYQAISGAGKTLENYPDIVANVIPYIGGEEQKSEIEPLKIWGTVENGKISSNSSIKIAAQCFRVPVLYGHTAAVFVSFKKKPNKDEIIERWKNYSGEAQKLALPLAPKQFIHYLEEDNRPQVKLDVNTENGMAVCCGRLREDIIFDYKFASLSHNTIRGAAGGAVLLGELLAAKGYFD